MTRYHTKGEKVAIFATADERYVPPSVMALRSFQRWFPEYNYFLLGLRVAMSAQSLALISRYGIELIDVDEAVRFVRPARYKNVNPLECFYIFKGPELLAERGYRYSLSVDGDVFCPRRFDLSAMCEGIQGFGGRPVGTLARTLGYKQRQQNEEFDFNDQRVYDVLGIDQEICQTRYEVNSGVVAWNNVAMAECEFFKKAVRVFKDCHGCFRGDQELLAFTAAAYHLPFSELDDSYNYNFFEDSLRCDAELREQMRQGQCWRIRIVHFVWCKPWRPTVAQHAVKAYFINQWRQFVLRELGDEAHALFEDLSFVRVRHPIGPFWNALRKVRAILSR
jgi:hypothetical protein